ncbi:hypothetical protein HWV62_18122 [Athelia sp. TMB]|nr:hypothetical protein HWV62_18122 [Athelia sp. TMB]
MHKISGCSPEMHRSLWICCVVRSSDGHPDKAGPIVRAAIESLLDAREMRCMDDVTVIGPVDEESNTMTKDQFVLSDTPEESIMILRSTVDDIEWDLGSVRAPEPRQLQFSGYIVAYGPRIMVWTSALSILLHATSGRMHARRLWVLIKGKLDLDHFVPGDIPGIDHGGRMRELSVWETHPHNTPAMSPAEVKDLEELGDEEQPDSGVESHPILLDAEPSLVDNHAFSSIERLPHEVFAIICAQIPLPTILSLASTSRSLRAKLLRTEADRNALARVWIKEYAPWYMPLPLHPSLKQEWVNPKHREATDGDYDVPDDCTAAIGWDYLRRCLASGSMRNRKRIWAVAEQIEKKAEELGV